jgi:hypothetical protein
LPDQVAVADTLYDGLVHGEAAEIQVTLIEGMAVHPDGAHGP